MSHAPECLKGRFAAADELVQELNESRCISENCSREEPGVKLMCQLWNILKDNPHLNLTEAVKEQTKKIQKQNLSIPLNVTNINSTSSNTSDVTCECSGDVYSSSSDTNSKRSTPCCSLKVPREPPGLDAAPLTKAIYNLNEATSIGKKCGSEIKTLMTIQKELENEVKTLEDKEKEVVETLKQTDCMWICMEEVYKKKINEALQKQEILLLELKKAEVSNTKWNKNQKDLELEVTKVDNCFKEMQEKTKVKTNDLMSIETEIKKITKQIEDTKKDLESTKKLADNKKKSSDNKLASMAVQVKKLEQTLEDERKKKHEKELEGNRSIKDKREELLKLTKVLMKKKLENMDLVQEKRILEADIDSLKQMTSQCCKKNSDREKFIDDEIARVDLEIAGFLTKDMRCNARTHTLDIKAYCMECPRCVQGDCDKSDKTTDCVCMFVKERLMSNVIENICTVLKKHSQTESGLAVAESVLNSLKRSRNGKLDSDTKRKLHDFIVSAMKKNLNDSIIGGAVKTRCELDDNTYNQLMMCLKEVQVESLSISDNDTKVYCPRFDTPCNCPGGPQGCVCQSSCPAGQQINSSQAQDSRLMKRRARSSNADNEVVLWKTEPCDGGSCKTVNSVRAVQCEIGPEVLTRESVAQSRLCDGCQVYPNMSFSSTAPTAALSSSHKDVLRVKCSLFEKNKTDEAKSCSYGTALKCKVKELTTGGTETGTKNVNVDDKSLCCLKNGSPEFSHINSFFVIKKTNVGTYEIILNKEFENVIKRNIKEHKLDWNSSEYILIFKESPSGQIIEIEPKGDHNKGKKDAVIVRTSSGSLRLFSTDSVSDCPNDNFTIVTKDDFMNLLMKFQSIVSNDTKTNATQTSTGWSKKSKSDSSVCQTTMVNINNETCYMEIEEMLKRTKSGNYILTLNKISCKKDLTKPTQKNYVKIPIAYNRAVALKHRIKVSACKCAHIFIDRNEIENIIQKCSKFTLKYDSTENIHICKGVQSESIISIRTCKFGSFESNIGSIGQEIKEIVEKPYKECCQKCPLLNPEKVNQKSDTNVNDETCASILKNILQNPPKCDTRQCLRHDCSDTEEEGSCNCNITNINTTDHDRQRRMFLLRSLENLPPQLPTFLKEFNLEMA